MPEIPSNTILIHGEQDDTIPLSAVLDWLRPQDIPVTVIPGADHFSIVACTISNSWSPACGITR
jgi:alpha/beta superfamily hydrolase